MTVFLHLEDLLAIAARIGRGEPGVRDLGLLESAAARPRTSVFGEEAYADLPTKAAALLESIVRNHALIDGNKRLGWLAAVVFFGLNDVELDAPDDDAYELVMGLARSENTVEDLTATLRSWHLMDGDLAALGQTGEQTLGFLRMGGVDRQGEALHRLEVFGRAVRCHQQGAIGKLQGGVHDRVTIPRRCLVGHRRFRPTRPT